jgi:predicted NBD/HSP70 family sugar kinase
MPGWDQYPIRDDLEKRWGCPISLNNDAELGALGEWAAGAGRGEGNLAYIKVGTGISAGLLLDGQIYRGVTGSAGEIGHLTINENGPVCTCGNHGCLEAIADGRAIALQAQEAVRKGKRTQMAAIQPVESISVREVAAAARRASHTARLHLPRPLLPPRTIGWFAQRITGPCLDADLVSNETRSVFIRNKCNDSLERPSCSSPQVAFSPSSSSVSPTI